jgi:O-antigen ligase
MRDSAVFRFDAVDAWAGLFVVYAGIRYFTSPGEYDARLEWLTLLSCATVFWVARYGLTHSSQGVFLLYILVLNGLGLSIFAIWLRMHPEYLPYGEDLALHYAPRMIGPFGCPNHLGDFLLVAFSAALGLALFTVGKWAVRVLLFYVAGLMLIVLALTLSRGSWLGLVFATLAITIFCIRHASLQWFFSLGVYLLGLVMGAVLLVRIPPFAQRIDEITQHIQQHTLDQYVRIQLAHDSLKIWRDHFWWGSGMATFNLEHPKYQGPLFNTHAYYAHNDYLNTLADYGLVGVILIAGFMVAVTWLLFRRVDYRSPSVRRILLCTGVAAWMGVTVHCLVDFNLHIPACALALFLVTGLGLRRSKLVGLHLPYGERQTVQLIFAGLLVVLLAGFVNWGWQTARGYYPYWKAVAYSPKLEPNISGTPRPLAEAIPLLKEAAQEDPANPLALGLLGDLYRTQAAGETEDAQKAALAQEAIHWYQAARQASPLDDDLLLKQGLVYGLLQRYPETYLCFHEAIAQQPYNGYYRQVLAAQLRAQGRVAEALEAYQAAQACPYGGEGADQEIAKLRQALPTPIDPYDHPPTEP